MIVSVENVSSYYNKENVRLHNQGKKEKVLNEISFEIEKGEVVGLVGESGSGKSTLAKVMLGLVKDYSGTVIHESRHPQMIFQDPYAALNPAKRIGWILEEPLRLRGGTSKEERLSKVRQMLEKVGLPEHYIDRYPRELSGGQRQRVCIAGALMLEPEFIIADEPVSALDVTIQGQILDLLRQINRELEISILFISHDLRVVYHMCDRVMIIKEGRIVEEGTIQQVYFSPKHDYTKGLLQAAGIRN